MLVSFAYIFLLGLSMGYIFNRLRLPALLGMLISGIILGPYALNALSPSLLSVSVELRQIALVIILMRAGLALDINDLKRVGRPALLMCFVPACFEIAGMMLVAPALLDISLLDAAVMGTVVAAVSPAIIVPKMLYLMENQIGTRKSIPQMIMAGGSVDDVFVIVLFTAFTTLSLGGEVSAASFVQIPVSIVTGLVSLAFLFLGLEGWLKGIVPISGLLAVMAMGATLLKTYPLLAKRISPKYSKLWVAAEILLFVLVGATVDIKFALAAGLAAVGVIFIVLLFRMVGVFVCMIHTDLTLRERLFCMIAYLPKATVQAAIGSLPLAMGLPCGKIVLTVAVLAILITAPLGAFGIDMTYKRLLMPSGRDQADPGNIPADSLGEFGGQNRNE